MLKRIALLAFTALALCSCSKNKIDQAETLGTPTVESFPIENTKFKNCNFHDQAPSYTVNSAIAPNVISCDEGVAKTVTLLSAAKLPIGLAFDMSKLALTGTPTEKVTDAPYDFYIENEAGYLILHLNLTVK
jgi:PBP1b-binding outer membrane lipoprotein LpoB